MTQSPKNTANRSSIFFLGGLVIAAGLAVGFDNSAKYFFSMSRGSVSHLDVSTHRPLGPRDLTAADQMAAEIAWAYFENNTRPETGWVDSVAGFPSTTIWDQGGYVLALISARKLELITSSEFSNRLNPMLGGLERLPLFDNRLPNKAYDTRDLSMVDYDNSESVSGVGWSALDVARMLSALRILERLHPDYGGQVRAILSKWDLESMVENGQLVGAIRDGTDTQFLQEGRLGYEQYAARAAALWGLDVVQAISARNVLGWELVSGVHVPIDIRSADAFGAITPTLSEPYILLALELGLDAESKVLAERIYLAQEARYHETGIQTAVSEDHIDQVPHFLYSSVIGNMAPWAVVDESGREYPRLRTVSTKAVFAWDAIYDTSYTSKIRSSLLKLGQADQGWQAGQYELNDQPNDVYTLNTNAVILEAMHYIAHGPLWQTR